MGIGWNRVSCTLSTRLTRQGCSQHPRYKGGVHFCYGLCSSPARTVRGILLLRSLVAQVEAWLIFRLHQAVPAMKLKELHGGIPFKRGKSWDITYNLQITRLHYIVAFQSRNTNCDAHPSTVIMSPTSFPLM